MGGVIWLASYPKSGNTWVRSFLATYFRNPEQPLDINQLYTFAYGDGFLTVYEHVSGMSREEMTPEIIRQLRPQVHRWMGGNPNQTVFCKTHSGLGNEGGVPLITPDATAGAIYVIRNPLDLAVSLAHHMQCGYGRAVEIMGTRDKIIGGDPNEHLPGTVGAWHQNVQGWLKAEGLTRHVMRYEDMHNKPGPTFRALVRFLGLPVEVQRLRKAIRFTSFNELSKQEARQGFIEARPDGAVSFFRRGRVGQWREVLTDAQVAQLIEEQGKPMRENGYLDKRGNPVF